MKRKHFFSRALSGMILVAFCVMSLTGCATLRKKFTRVKKNKDQKEDFIPVLQPIEYKKIEEATPQVYAEHYSMVKVYFKDLWEVLGKDESSAKREKYMFTEILSHFDAMTALLTEAKRQEAQKLRARFKLVLAVYDEPDGSRRYDLMTGFLRAIERDLYKLFKPAAVAGDLIPSVK
ncbi:MAG: hypothetical protein HQL17_05915 [Candidatus Omnitrophica bacterium]|nr:hypothetical protein [Candidatus Omnitrophota bacterium]